MSPRVFARCRTIRAAFTAERHCWQPGDFREILVVLSLKVGYLVPGVVVKSMPYHDSHLILISGTELLAFLPKKYANKPYKVGQNLLACVFMLENNRIILSQRCHHYYKRIAERAFSVLIEEEKIRIRRAATVTGAGFVKMAVEGLNGVDPVKECLPYLPAMKAVHGRHDHPRPLLAGYQGVHKERPCPRAPRTESGK